VKRIRKSPSDDIRIAGLEAMDVREISGQDGGEESK
jgi:hypothetical protein